MVGVGGGGNVSGCVRLECVGVVMVVDVWW